MKYVLLFSISLLLSCNSGNNSENQNSNLVDISLNTWILNNQELKSKLSDFIQASHDDSGRENSYIQIFYSAINDSTCSYNFFEWIDINSFIYRHPHVIFQFEKKMVFFYVEGLEGLDIFRINDDFLVEFMKKNFPDQYNYYLKVGDYPPPITGGGLEWELIFQNGKLVRKKEYYTQ